MAENLYMKLCCLKIYKPNKLAKSQNSSWFSAWANAIKIVWFSILRERPTSAFSETRHGWWNPIRRGKLHQVLVFSCQLEFLHCILDHLWQKKKEDDRSMEQIWEVLVEYIEYHIILYIRINIYIYNYIIIQLYICKLYKYIEYIEYIEYHIISYHTNIYYIILCYIILYYIILFYILYCIILNYIILFYILYCIILYV